MKQFKGTPGPWVVKPEEVDRDYVRIRGTRLGGRYKVANVVTPQYEGVLSREAEETRANANLIAAAPELLDALQAVVTAMRQYEMDVGETAPYKHRMMMEKAEAALKKALGE